MASLVASNCRAVAVIFSRPGSVGEVVEVQFADVAYPSYLFRSIVAPSKRNGDNGGMFFPCRDAANGCSEENPMGMVGLNP